MPHALTLVSFAAAKWAHAQAKSWQCILEMQLDGKVMAMSPNECPFGWSTPEVLTAVWRARLPFPCGAEIPFCPARNTAKKQSRHFLPLL